MDISEKVAYIKGLAEGLSLDVDTKEGKLIAAIIDVLSDISSEISSIEENAEEMQQQIDAVDEDLALVEELFEDEDEDDECDCCNDEELYEVECPSCHNIIYVDDEMLEDEGVNCPNCGTPLEFDFECCDDDCDCHDEHTEE